LHWENCLGKRKGEGEHKLYSQRKGGGGVGVLSYSGKKKTGTKERRGRYIAVVGGVLEERKEERQAAGRFLRGTMGGGKEKKD